MENFFIDEVRFAQSADDDDCNINQKDKKGSTKAKGNINAKCDAKEQTTGKKIFARQKIKNLKDMTINEVKEILHFQNGNVVQVLPAIPQTLHNDNSACIAHIPGSQDGVSIMCYKTTGSKIECENANMPYGYGIFLHENAKHGGWLGCKGSFRHHFALKLPKHIKPEPLVRKDNDVKLFLAEFPDCDVKPMTDDMNDKLEKSKVHFVDETDCSDHQKQIFDQLKLRRIRRGVRNLK